MHKLSLIKINFFKFSYFKNIDKTNVHQPLRKIFFKRKEFKELARIKYDEFEITYREWKRMTYSPLILFAISYATHLDLGSLMSLIQMVSSCALSVFLRFGVDKYFDRKIKSLKIQKNFNNFKIISFNENTSEKEFSYQELQEIYLKDNPDNNIKKIHLTFVKDNKQYPYSINLLTNDLSGYEDYLIKLSEKKYINF